MDICSLPSVLIKRVHSDAVFPTKAHFNDIGYDLTLIEKVSQISDGIVMYDTGIAVEPPHGFYVEIVPRSSFSKTGHVLANSIGIIDPQYRGTLKVVVLHVDRSMPPLPIPYKGFQMILRQANVFSITEVSDLSTTQRGEGGFGSSDKVGTSMTHIHVPPIYALTTNVNVK